MSDELEGSIFKSGAMVKFDDNKKSVVFVDTRKDVSSRTLLETYDIRWDIEEAHRQLKVFQGLEKLPSKKFIQVVFRIIMGLVSHNLFNLFLNAKRCATLKDFTLKLLRQQRDYRKEINPEFIVYTRYHFAIIKMYDFLQLILVLKKRIRDRLYALFERMKNMSKEDHLYGIAD